MTESSWTAWCRLHRCWVGPAAPADEWREKLFVHRPANIKNDCNCPDETLEIRSTFEDPPWYAGGPREWSPRE